MKKALTYKINSIDNESKGFTFIEIITVLIIIGVLSAIAASKIIDIGAEEAAEAELLKTNLHYAQSKAMSQGLEEEWGILVSPSSYTLIKGNVQSSLNFPASESSEYTFENVKIVSGSGKIEFDFLGRPYFNDTLLTTTHVIKYSGGREIEIIPETGLVQ